MTSVIIFVGALLGLIAFALAVNRIRGVRAHYIEDWQPDAGERILFRDMEADTFIVGVNRAHFVTYGRPRRGTVIVTDRRIIAGTRTLFGRKSMLLYMIYGGPAPGGFAQMLDGGLFTRGYRTFVVLPHATRKTLDEKKPYVDLKPSPDERSSINVDFIRIYTDQAASFPA